MVLQTKLVLVPVWISKQDFSENTLSPSGCMDLYGFSKDVICMEFQTKFVLVSVSDVLLMLRTYWITYNSKDEERQALIQFIKTLAGPEFETWSISNYMISRIYDPPKNKITLQFYCSKCDEPFCKIAMRNNLGTITSECAKCKVNYQLTSRSLNCIWSIDIEYQIQQLLHQKEIQVAFMENVEKIRQIESKKSARFARTFSSDASRAARFVRKNERAEGTRHNVVALRAPTYMNFALRAQCCTLHSA